MHTCDCPLGLGELESNISFSMYPNPTVDGNVTINASENIVTIQITNVLGQVVVSEKFNDLAKTRTINSAELTKGMYTVSIIYDNNNSSKTNLVVR